METSQWLLIQQGFRTWNLVVRAVVEQRPLWCAAGAKDLSCLVIFYFAQSHACSLIMEVWLCLLCHFVSSKKITTMLWMQKRRMPINLEATYVPEFELTILFVIHISWNRNWLTDHFIFGSLTTGPFFMQPMYVLCWGLSFARRAASLSALEVWVI
jgi:hypothetical protein